MNKIIAGITITACVPPCGHETPRWRKLPAEPEINATSAEIEARSEETPDIFVSEVMSIPEVESVTESNTPKTEITAEKEAEKPAPAQTAQKVEPTASTSEPHNGNVRIVDGEKQIYLLGFGWIKDEGGGSVGTMVGNPGDQLTGHNVGIMGGRTTADGKGDINKQVGIMGGGTVAEDMYENGNKIGIMGGGECPSNESTPPLSEQPEIKGYVIYTELQPPVTKNSTPPPNKPNGEPTNP